jgi:biopolymer transport protein ExbB/TolQ
MFGDIYTKEVLHIVAQSLLVPVIIILICFIAISVFFVGSTIVEIFTERRHFKVVMPTFLNALTDASTKYVPGVLENSGLLKRQREALQLLFDNRRLPEEARTSLAKRLIADDEMRYQRILARSDLLSRISPMLGLMATLIPLGPGIIALGQGDTAALSDSLLTAFDATVAGLATSVVCLAVSKLRKHWYENYMISLEAGANTILEKIQLMHDRGDIVVDVLVDSQGVVDGEVIVEAKSNILDKATGAENG